MHVQRERTDSLLSDDRSRLVHRETESARQKAEQTDDRRAEQTDRRTDRPAEPGQREKLQHRGRKCVYTRLCK